MSERRVLVISYYWSPSGGPGAQRAVKSVRYLPQFGWQPVVLTVRDGEYPYTDPSLAADVPAGVHVYRTQSLEPFRLYKNLTKRENAPLPVGVLSQEKGGPQERLAAWARLNVFIPDARVGWVPFAVRAGVEIVQRERIDLIFTSSPPHSLQLAGWLLKRITGLPWVADLRDPWTEGRHYRSVERAFWARGIDRFWERVVLRTADHVTTVSPALAAHFRERSGGAATCSVLTNGYDEADYTGQAVEESSGFQILHAGNALADQNPAVLWRGMQQLAQEKPAARRALRIRFIGRVHAGVLDSARQAGLAEWLEVRDFMPHREVVQELRRAAVLWAVVPRVEGNAGIVTAKLFEYIGSGRPILLIGPVNGDAARIVARFPNSAACDYDDVASCTAFIRRVYEAWENGHVPESDPHLRAPFSRRAVTAALAEILERFV